MAALFILILKTTIQPKKLIPKSLGVSDYKINRFDIGDRVEYAKKSEKTSKSQNLAKSRKILSKSGNLTNFDATEIETKYLTPDARTTFNYLWLAFIKAPIL